MYINYARIYIREIEISASNSKIVRHSDFEITTKGRKWIMKNRWVNVRAVRTSRTTTPK